MNNNELGRVLTDQALVNEAPSGIHPSGFDPSRDFVHEHFRAHYPEDADSWEAKWCCGGVERRYQGASGRTIFPEIVTADGLRISVQGHFGAYSYPRGDFEESYQQVEIMGPRHLPELSKYEQDCNAVGEEMIYPYVPVELVNSMIAGRGGLAALAIEAGTGETVGLDGEAAKARAEGNSHD